jgi:formylglycine-generating enzyme required for sulfatase activity
LILLQPSLKAFSPARHALLIGNSAYGDQCRVDTPKHNVETLVPLLKDIGFDSKTAFDLDEDSTRRDIGAFVSSLGRGDVVFLFYSGFAIQAEDRNWLLPVSYRHDQFQTIERHAYGLERMLEQMEETHVGAVIVILDANRACRAWPETNIGLTEVSLNAGFLIAFPAQRGHILDDPGDGSSSPFAKELANSLATPGLNAAEVVEKTQEALRNAGSLEIPWFDSVAVGDFILTRPLPPPPPKPGARHINQIDLLNYAWVPPGIFQMGCVPQDNHCAEAEKPRHQVKVKNGFWITSTEITVEAFDRFADATQHRRPASTRTNKGGLMSNLPETEVTWQDAQDYCGWASSGGRLPSEAEWEYAARGAKDGTIYPWGDVFNAEETNSFEKSRRKGKYNETTPVERYHPNSLNLFDVIGNVREWTLDVYDAQAYAGPGPFVDPVVGRQAKGDRVLRGGSFYENARDLRISARDHRPAGKGDNQTGFRCVAADIQ